MSAPTWDDVTDATVLGQVVGYELGIAHGLRLAAVERDTEALWARAAEVIANSVRDFEVPAARELADTYPEAVAPAERRVDGPRPGASGYYPPAARGGAA